MASNPGVLKMSNKEGKEAVERGDGKYAFLMYAMQSFTVESNLSSNKKLACITRFSTVDGKMRTNCSVMYE